MFASKRVLALMLVCLCGLATAQSQNELLGERALGPQWKLLSRAAGMVFSGTVLRVEAVPAATDRAIPAIQIKFRVDRAIVGVRQGQILTIHEWIGAWSSHRPMQVGKHMLLFLYRPSRLGLTSPVGGRLGQIPIDGKGNVVIPPLPVSGGRVLPPRLPRHVGLGKTRIGQQSISVRQLERAVRSAREE